MSQINYENSTVDCGEQDKLATNQPVRQGIAGFFSALSLFYFLLFTQQQALANAAVAAVDARDEVTDELTTENQQLDYFMSDMLSKNVDASEPVVEEFMGSGRDPGQQVQRLEVAEDPSELELSNEVGSEPVLLHSAQEGIASTRSPLPGAETSSLFESDSGLVQTVSMVTPISREMIESEDVQLAAMTPGSSSGSAYSLLDLSTLLGVVGGMYGLVQLYDGDIHASDGSSDGSSDYSSDDDDSYTG